MGELKTFGPEDFVVCPMCNTTLPKLMWDLHDCPAEMESPEEGEEEEASRTVGPAVYFALGIQILHTVLLLIITILLIFIVAK